MDRRMDGVGVGVLEVWKQLKLDHWVQNQGGKTREGGRTYRREEAENKKTEEESFEGVTGKRVKCVTLEKCS